MKGALTKNSIAALPIHDAEFILLDVSPLANGEVRLSLAARLHKDESQDELLALGIKTRSFRITFESSWQVVSNILGFGDGKDTIDRWDILDDSDLLRDLKSFGLAQSVKLEHHRFGFSDRKSTRLNSSH